MEVYKTKVFSFSEISMHNKAEDCWVIIHGKAYNVTNFLTDHPGGEEILLATTEKDGSEDFENAGHGSASRLMLDEFYVGEVDPLTIPKVIIDLPTKETRKDDLEPSGRISRALMFGVPLLILVFAIAMKINLYTSLD